MAGGSGAKGSAARIRVNTILCTDPKHPIWEKLRYYAADKGFLLTPLVEKCSGGEFLFLLSCTQFVDRTVRAKYKHVLVIHESDLPNGRGWSPVAWQILEGKDRITVSLIEAADSIDAGDIWFQEDVYIPKHALADEISTRLWATKRRLIEKALSVPVKPRRQEGIATYYHRRTPEDSRIDPEKSIAEQFDLLRICDPRFPAFFDYRGFRYRVRLEKV